MFNLSTFDFITHEASLLIVLWAMYYDKKYFRIPNKITFPSIILGLILTLIAAPHLFMPRVGAIVVTFFLGTLGLMGMGDLKLCMAVIALRGWREALLTVILACVLMLIVCIKENPRNTMATVKVTFKKMVYRMPFDADGEKYPFAVFISAGYCIMHTGFYIAQLIAEEGLL